MYNILDSKQTKVLELRRHGWLSPEYELTYKTINAEEWHVVNYG